MAKKESKTKPTDHPIQEYLQSVGPKKQEDSQVLIDMMKKISGMEPEVWGNSMVGFGSMRYESSSCTGLMPLLAFAPRKAKFTIHIWNAEQYEKILQDLGKHTTGVGCIYVNKLADIDLQVLDKILRLVWEDAKNLPYAQYDAGSN